MERKKLIVGNWKMHATVEAASEMAGSLKKIFAHEELDAEIVICPPFTALSVCKKVLEGSKIILGAQNAFYLDEGAYTGEISFKMLEGLSRYVIIGHSERRKYFNETDEQVNLKILAGIKKIFRPIVCVGETKEQREADETVSLVKKQVTMALQNVSPAACPRIVFAYEPIWAIGTGIAANPEDASTVILLIRKIIADLYGHEVAEKIRILYGGSVDSKNVAAFTNEPAVDGVLVGGASVKISEFVNIVRAVLKK